MKARQLQQLRERYEKWCYENKVSSDIFDFEAEVDKTLDYYEAWNEIEEKLRIISEEGTVVEKQTRDLLKETDKELKDGLAFGLPKEMVDKLKVVFITADAGEGKTALSYFLLEKLKKFKDIYVFGNPNKEMIRERGYKNMYSIDEVEDMKNIILWIDEPQIVLPKYEKRGSVILNKLLSLTRQKDIVLILSTSDTRYITSTEEFYVNTYFIKRIDYQMIKRGSKVKQILNDIATITPEGYSDNIAKNEFVFYNRQTKQINGKYSFKLPNFFDEKHSKPFS